MLAVARREASRAGSGIARRIRFADGLADRLPLPDAAVDVAVSSFVLQLVPHRGRVLRDIHRVLRPGGGLAYVTWRVASDPPFAPDEAFYDALDEAGVPDDGGAEEPRSGDVPSAAAAASQARRAGFSRVVARDALLEHPFERATYLDFLERYAERETFEDLTGHQRRKVLAAARRRLARLDDAAFTWRAPVVILTAKRPIEG
jgi:SAM-dependent methyltransferase